MTSGMLGLFGSALLISSCFHTGEDRWRALVLSLIMFGLMKLAGIQERMR